jgi:hypothetical protein
MQKHGSTCLKGPVRGSRTWWQMGDANPQAEAPPVKKRQRRSSGGAGVRQDLVERVRKEIVDGVYDTPERWEAALDRLLDALDRA